MPLHLSFVPRPIIFGTIRPCLFTFSIFELAYPFSFIYYARIFADVLFSLCTLHLNLSSRTGFIRSTWGLFIEYQLTSSTFSFLLLFIAHRLLRLYWWQLWYNYLLILYDLEVLGILIYLHVLRIIHSCSNLLHRRNWFKWIIHVQELLTTF